MSHTHHRRPTLCLLVKCECVFSDGGKALDQRRLRASLNFRMSHTFDATFVYYLLWRGASSEVVQDAFDNYLGIKPEFFNSVKTRVPIDGF